MEAHWAVVGNNNLMSNKLPAIPNNIINENINKEKFSILFINGQEII